MGKSLMPPGDGGDHIEPVDLKRALEERYLAYALSTIMHRALPDVRDGLKPVHRRIMHAMRLLRLNPDQGFAKCARIVGEVMGKFHPHGDQSIYDALVRLAQSFSMRYPLVDGQGNFGNIDGDNAAAMRYTEARMTDVATELLAGITEDAVDFRPTYNEEDEEPVVLPGAFPNLLANGSSGIAVGMATSIPPHNAAELCDAALCLIDGTKSGQEISDDRLMEFVQGPDFPTGGIIIDSRASIAEAYRTGRGSFRVRSRWHQEDHGRGTWTIAVTEIPYGVQKSRLIEKIAELLIARKLPLLEDIRDESAEDIRIVLVPKSRTVDPGILMESLFKLTELESRFSLNMNVLSRGKVPNVLSLKSVLREWLDHRREVLQRRSRHRLAEIERRLEILAGYLIAYLNIDEVIRHAGRSDSEHAVALSAQAGRVRDPQGIRCADRGKAADRGAAGRCAETVEHHCLGNPDHPPRFRAGRKQGTGAAPHQLRGSAGARPDRHCAGDDRKGTGHRRHLRKGLAARHEGASERLFAALLQGGRQP
jgi:topoisomerase-4 subunit A